MVHEWRAGIFRIASMTKIMGGVMAAIAFEEGVLAPSDPIGKWIPEFAAEKMVGVAQLNAESGATEVVPLNRNITVFDLLGMKGGFSYGKSASASTTGLLTGPGVGE